MRKVLEILEFQALGSFETLGSKLSHGTSLKFADVRTHLRKVSKNTIKKEAAGFFSYFFNPSSKLLEGASTWMVSRVNGLVKVKR